jgi:hypothetical protein
MTAIAVFFGIAFLVMWSWSLQQAWMINDLRDNLEIKQCVIQTLNDRHAQMYLENMRLKQVRPPEGLVAYGSQRAGGERG